jgi:hypothetical protein
MRPSLKAVASLLLMAALVFPALANPDFPPVKFATVRSPVPHGGQGLVTIQTKPGTYCTISVIYKSGPSHAVGLAPQTADARGQHYSDLEGRNQNYTRHMAYHRRMWSRRDHPYSGGV